MKIGRFIVAAVLAVSVSGFAFAADDKSADKKADKKYKEGGCCATAIAKGETCKHDCCIAAEKKGEVCTKCNPPKKEGEKK
jgi:hypothetical protein